MEEGGGRREDGGWRMEDGGGRIDGRGLRIYGQGPSFDSARRFQFTIIHSLSSILYPQSSILNPLSSIFISSVCPAASRRPGQGPHRRRACRVWHFRSRP